MEENNKDTEDRLTKKAILISKQNERLKNIETELVHLKEEVEEVIGVFERKLKTHIP